MEQQTSVGAILGCSVCIVLAWGNPPLVVLLAAVAGFSFGSIVGFLIWIASIRLPDEPIVKPFQGDERRQRRGAPCTTRSGRVERLHRPCPGHQLFAAPRDLRVGLRVADPGAASKRKAVEPNWLGWLSRWWKPDGKAACQPNQLHQSHQAHLWRLLRSGFGTADVGHGIKSALRQRSFPARRKHVYR